MMLFEVKLGCGKEKPISDSCQFQYNLILMERKEFRITE